MRIVIFFFFLLIFFIGTNPFPPSLSTLTFLIFVLFFFFLGWIVADIISTVEFDHTGDYLATGDKGGRVVLFERNESVSWLVGVMSRMRERGREGTGRGDSRMMGNWGVLGEWRLGENTPWEGG